MGRIVGYLVPKKPAEKKQETEKPAVDTNVADIPAADISAAESPASRGSKKKVQNDA
ncbi:hypothetical protein [Gemmiger sp. An50]|uniref:hypothetical protein n=1 Tax=Gemmiger sp. An50 TaxID=1965639 RepID=UPI0013A63F00|nr:hypothetical protein [Gemmiger sp. An50]